MVPRLSIAIETAWGIAVALALALLGTLPKYRDLSDVQKAFMLGRSTAGLRGRRPEIDETTLRLQLPTGPVSHR